MEGENALSYFRGCLGYCFGHFRVSLRSDSEPEFIAQQKVNRERLSYLFHDLVFGMLNKKSVLFRFWATVQIQQVLLLWSTEPFLR